MEKEEIYNKKSRTERIHDRVKLKKKYFLFHNFEIGKNSLFIK